MLSTETRWNSSRSMRETAERCCPFVRNVCEFVPRYLASHCQKTVLFWATHAEVVVFRNKGKGECVDTAGYSLHL
jgi:hypothetical protein